MRWFAKQERASEIPAEPAPSQPRIHRSKVLSPALQSLDRQESPRVLDLGPPSPVNMDFFSGRGCALEIFDLFSWISDFRSPGRHLRQTQSGSAIGAALDRLLGDDEETRSSSDAIDLILVWELFDHLELDEIGELFERLAGRTRPGTRAMTLVTYRGNLPARPRRYEVVSETELSSDDPRSAGREHRGFKEVALLDRLVDWELEKGILMQNGIQEFLFERSRRGRWV